MPSSHLILCHSLLLLALNLSQHQCFSNKSVLHIRWMKYWSFILSISPSNEYSGLISIRIDWFDLLEVQETQESSPTPRFKSINSLVLSFLYGPTLTFVCDYWKNHSFDYTDLCCQSDVSAFYMLSRLVTTLLPRNKCLSISRLQSPSVVILEPPQNKICHCFYFFFI